MDKKKLPKETGLSINWKRLIDALVLDAVDIIHIINEILSRKKE